MDSELKLDFIKAYNSQMSSASLNNKRTLISTLENLYASENQDKVKELVDNSVLSYLNLEWFSDSPLLEINLIQGCEDLYNSLVSTPSYVGSLIKNSDAWKFM